MSSSFKPPNGSQIDVRQLNPDPPKNHRPIYIRATQGLWRRLRQTVATPLVLLFLGLPWVTWGERPAIWLNIAEQKFYIFNLIIWPQDLILLAQTFILGALGLFFITTYIGRIWCGYTCPQTIWTLAFVWVEELIEGSRHQRMKLDEQPWSYRKTLKKTIKHSIWLLIAMVTSLTFVSYFVPARQLYVDVFSLDVSWMTTGWILLFAGATYLNAGWIREIFCANICPYARLQAVMFDKDTITVSYDFNRGEPRGKRSRRVIPAEVGLGDCIDCGLCVQVCPAGIDIRDGLQYECINCGCCVDVCHQTMTKMHYPTGLIRYTSESELENRSKPKFRFKLYAYGFMFAIGLTLFALNISSLSAVQLDIIRDRGQLYRENMDGLIENSYTLKILNKTELDLVYQISVSGLQDYQWFGMTSVQVKSGEVLSVPVSIAVDPYDLSKPIISIVFSVESLGENSYQTEKESRFFGP